MDVTLAPARHVQKPSCCLPSITLAKLPFFITVVGLIVRTHPVCVNILIDIVRALLVESSAEELAHALFHTSTMKRMLASGRPHG